MTLTFSGNVTVNPASLAKGAEATTNVTVSGLNVGDWVRVIPPSGLESGLLVFEQVVQIVTANTLPVRIYNQSAADPVDPASTTWEWARIQIAPTCINVMDYDAVGDGVADDTPSIQAAIDAAGGTTGQAPVIGQSAIVFLPDGNYKVTTQLELWSHQILRGAGMGTTITFTGTGYAIRTKNNANYVTLHSFNIFGDDNTASDGGIFIGNLSSESGFTAYCSLRDIFVKAFGKTDAIGVHLRNPLTCPQ